MSQPAASATTDDTAAPPEPWHLIHDGQLDLDAVQAVLADNAAIVFDREQRLAPPDGARVLISLDDETIRELAPVAIEKNWVVALLPHPESPLALRSLGVSGSLEQVLSHYIAQQDPVAVDLLTCNGQVAFSGITIGEVLTLRPYDINKQPTRWTVFKRAATSARQLQPQSYRITTGKDQKVGVAALGMVVLAQNRSSLVGRSFGDLLGGTDRRLTAVVLAPRSILGYLWFLVRLLLPKPLRPAQLPQSVGVLRSEKLSISIPTGVDYLLDRTHIGSKTIDCELLPQALQALPGPFMSRSADTNGKSSKDSIRVRHLPMEDSVDQLKNKPLPLFSHATESEYRELFVSLRENASVTSPYIVLTILSVLLAVSGLYANSAPVIIGAMILAPLMAPLISLSMGLARTDGGMIRMSLRTLGAGIGVGLFCAVLVAWLMPLVTVTAEMHARVSPTLLDLSIAALSGIAGAYAHTREEIAKSLAGVAIAVALVPPLSVAGIGIGWMDWHMAGGAFLLFVTNLVGIALAGAITFLVLGFAHFRLAKTGLGAGAGLTAIVAIPLYFAFQNLVALESLRAQVPVGMVFLDRREVHIRDVRVIQGSTPLISMTLSASYPVTTSQVDELKAMISANVEEPFILEAEVILRR